jgi:hypothetical protein
MRVGRSAVTLTAASLFHVPPPISDESNFDTPLSFRVWPPWRATASEGWPSSGWQQMQALFGAGLHPIAAQRQQQLEGRT